ncbi:ABC-three component system middle component 7 [Peptoniphilus genitalis]|nr:hypothetical protein [Peptoniphilus harei]
MILPNKLFTYEESSLSKFPAILNILKEQPITASELYNKTNHLFLDIDDYVDTLCSLFALNKILLNENGGTLHYVEND